ASAEEHACESLAERLVASGPTAEEGPRAFIRLYQHRGKANVALRQFLLVKEALRRELGVEPENETEALVSSRRGDGMQPANEQQAPAAATPTAAALHESDRPSIVILPFENLSGPDDEYLVDGIVEEITAML